MEPVDNNQFEVITAKRKIQTGPNVYLNPALDLLANEDPMCNNAMEITATKKRKRTKSCDIVAFENSGLDLGVNKAAVNEFLMKELENVRKNFKTYKDLPTTSNSIEPLSQTSNSEPIYANLTELHNATQQNTVPEIELSPVTSIHKYDIDSVDHLEADSGISIVEQKSLSATTTQELINNDLSSIHQTMSMQTNLTNQVFINNTSNSNINLSFIDRLALDSPMNSNQSLYLDDDLNESNIMEIKTITIITKKKIVSNKKNTNPFLDPNLQYEVAEGAENPFLDRDETNDLEYNTMAPREIDNVPNNIMPRRLFAHDTNSTVSTFNESSMPAEAHEYENVGLYRSESPIYENIGEDIVDTHYNKQSKILGCDVSQFSSGDILNRNSQNNTNDSQDSKKDSKHNLFKATKLSKKVFKTLKKKFKGEKVEANVTLNPYEVPRKTPKIKSEKKEPGIENPALKLDNSDEIEIEELDEEHQYETIKTIRNTRLNTNVTPLRERAIDNIDTSQNRTYTPGKKVRFDSTMNKEKIITGNSFDCGIQSPGFDAKIDKYHDELENCINERKFIQQNM
ncbi:uncharacterized protein LOC121727886 [Aricia agestis]|uniref:uncharacterized protein LOC121727886 n=1 Tax=Aricia agestis TaxID=91739 RepID=UPI001C2063D5|nr:uncharacterized protein LOC121727886 [Aricia agestis]